MKKVGRGNIYQQKKEAERSAQIHKERLKNAKANPDILAAKKPVPMKIVSRSGGKSRLKKKVIEQENLTMVEHLYDIMTSDRYKGSYEYAPGIRIANDGKAIIDCYPTERGGDFMKLHSGEILRKKEEKIQQKALNAFYEKIKKVKSPYSRKVLKEQWDKQKRLSEAMRATKLMPWTMYLLKSLNPNIPQTEKETKDWSLQREKRIKDALEHSTGGYPHGVAGGIKAKGVAKSYTEQNSPYADYLPNHLKNSNVRTEKIVTITGNTSNAIAHGDINGSGTSTVRKPQNRPFSAPATKTRPSSAPATETRPTIISSSSSPSRPKSGNLTHKNKNKLSLGRSGKMVNGKYVAPLPRSPDRGAKDWFKGIRETWSEKYSLQQPKFVDSNYKLPTNKVLYGDINHNRPHTSNIGNLSRDDYESRVRIRVSKLQAAIIYSKNPSSKSESPILKMLASHSHSHSASPPSAYQKIDLDALKSPLRPVNAYPWDNRVATQIRHRDHRHLERSMNPDYPVPDAPPLAAIPDTEHVSYSDLFDHNRGRHVDRSRSPSARSHSPKHHDHPSRNLDESRGRSRSRSPKRKIDIVNQSATNIDDLGESYIKEKKETSTPISIINTPTITNTNTILPLSSSSPPTRNSRRVKRREVLLYKTNSTSIPDSTIRASVPITITLNDTGYIISEMEGEEDTPGISRAVAVSTGLAIVIESLRDSDDNQQPVQTVLSLQDLRRISGHYEGGDESLYRLLSQIKCVDKEHQLYSPALSNMLEAIDEENLISLVLRSFQVMSSESGIYLDWIY